jgi:hypothetical protein
VTTISIASVSPVEAFHSSGKVLLIDYASVGIRTPNQKIMRRFEGHQQDEMRFVRDCHAVL